MPNQRLDFLFRKCLDNTINEAEKSELHGLLTDPANAEIIQNNIDNLLAEPATQTLDSHTKTSIITAITAADKQPGVTAPVKQLVVTSADKQFAVTAPGKQPGITTAGKQPALVKPMNRQWIKYAAAIIILLSAGLYYFTFTRSNKNNSNQTIATDIQPGGNRATLTLADGTTILLDSANNSTLAQQGNIQIIKLDNGQIVYKPLNNNTSSEILYNTISTPIGGKYQIQLPDGTNVWLNATSSIRFPAKFTGAERIVELTGEAYFDVAKNPSQPFIVNSNNISVKVLGTEFNIMAYKDEQSIRTTLINGAVNVISNNNNNILKPGQQASIENGSTRITNNANIEEALAWKNGNFYFNNADIKTVMRQIGRWYDVQIKFEGNPGNEKFEGEISRNSPLSEVLKILALTSVRFRLEGNKLIVLP